MKSSAVIAFLALIAIANSALYFEKIFIIVLENESYNVAVSDPYMNMLTPLGQLLTRYSALTHPSQPNYIAMIGGDTLGVSGDGNVDLNQRSLVDLLEESGITWKAYQENYPGNSTNVFTGESYNNLYYRKHNPFMSFTGVSTNSSRFSKIVDAVQLDFDISTNSVPQFSFFTPNINNDGHDTGMNYAAAWLNNFLCDKISNPNFITNMLVVVTFDEGYRLAGNQVYTLLLGPGIPVGTKDHNKYDHYSLLRTVETNWGLATLGRNDNGATAFNLTKIQDQNWGPWTQTLSCVQRIDDKGVGIILAVTFGLILLVVFVIIFAIGVANTVRHNRGLDPLGSKLTLY